MLGCLRCVGVSIKGGHEVQVLQSWFGVRLWRVEEDAQAMAAEWADRPLKATDAAGVRVIGFDHDIDGIIIFSSPIGVYVQGACNLLQVHCAPPSAVSRLRRTQTHPLPPLVSPLFIPPLSLPPL